MNINYDFIIEDSLIFNTDLKKELIVLTNTTYPINDHLTKIKLRFNRKYNKVPSYTIDRVGALYLHHESEKCAYFFEDIELNKKSIVISLENVGWLDRVKDKDTYVDWRGMVYNGTITERYWRCKKYWADYTFEQIETLIQLIDYLCKKHNIEKNFVGHNVFFDGAKNFKGIVNRGNFNKNYYDLTPAFDFEELNKKLNQ